jgi:Ca2+-binding RTX toxin-like protein
VLLGGADNDSIDGGTGIDTVSGGTGTNILVNHELIDNAFIFDFSKLLV